MADEDETTNSWFAKDHEQRRQEIRDDLKKKALELQARGDSEASLTESDDALSESIKLLGFEGSAARVLDLLPLVLVSWADGEVQHGERKTILDVLAGRGIKPGDDAWMLMETLLEKPPPEAYVDECLSVLRALRVKYGSGTGGVVQLCLKVAEASGGLFGIGSVSDSERTTLHSVAVALGGKAEKRFQRLLG